MNDNVVLIKPDACPLCGKSNACELVANGPDSTQCWCTDPNLTFPKALIDKLPEALKGKSCICKECVVNFNNKRAEQ